MERVAFSPGGLVLTSREGRLQSARDRASRVLLSLGIVTLLFSILWFTLAVKRIVKYPPGRDHEVICTGRVERPAAKHGLETFSPPQQAEISLKMRLVSVDEEYTSDTAVVKELIGRGTDVLGELDLDDVNTYVFGRRDCMNRKSRLSVSAGETVDRSGSWYVNFPLGTGRQSYNMFDNDAASSFAVNYAGEKRIGGLKVFTFKGSFGYRPMVDYRVQARGLPEKTTFGELKQELERSGVPLESMIEAAYPRLTQDEIDTLRGFPDHMPVDLEYTVKARWEGAVEPVTGTVVDISGYSKSIFVSTDFKVFLPLLEILARYSEDPLVSRYLSQIEQQKLLEPSEVYRVEYNWEPESVKNMVDYANGRIGPVRLVKNYLVVITMMLGAALIVVGLLLRRERHPKGPGSGSVAGGGGTGSPDRGAAGRLEGGDTCSGGGNAAGRADAGAAGPADAGAVGPAGEVVDPGAAGPADAGCAAPRMKTGPAPREAGRRRRQVRPG